MLELHLAVNNVNKISAVLDKSFPKLEYISSKFLATYGRYILSIIFLHAHINKITDHTLIDTIS